MTQRISEWIPLRADKQGANITIIPWQKRPDLDQFAKDTVVYEIKDLWTTVNGGWDNVNDRFGVPQWARDTYLKPWINGHMDPDGIPAGGTSEAILLSCLNSAGQWQVGKGMMFSTEREKAVAQGVKAVDNAGKTVWTMREIAPDHWYVIEMTKSSVYMPDGSKLPDYGIVGPWVLMPVGLGDIVVGAGLPYSWHVATFAVWQEKARTGVVNPPVDPPVDPPIDPIPGDPPSGSFYDMLKQASDALVEAAGQASGIDTALERAKLAVSKAQELLG
jgi:hypothetical protein